MRVTMENMPAAVRTDVSDLLGRLDKGDVIQARVLDVKPGEAVLRLSDGSLLSARSEGLEAKPGQMLTLLVTSREEGTLYLETVKEPARQNSVDFNTAISMLKSVQRDPDPQSIAIASEFAKSGIPITAELMDQAAGLMKGFEGLDAEKAVFIMEHSGILLQTGDFAKQNAPHGGLDAPEISLAGYLSGKPGLAGDFEPVRLELLSKLLDGELKLGNQIKELQALLGRLGENLGKGPDTHFAPQRGIIAAETGLSGQTASRTPHAAANIQNIVSAADEGGGVNPAGNAEGNGILRAALKSEQRSALDATSGPADAKSSGTADVSAKMTADTSKQTGAQAPAAAGQTTSAYEADLSGIHNTGSETDEFFNTKVQPDSYMQLKDAMEKIFVDIHSDKLPEELNLSGMHRELRNKLGILKDSIRASGPAVSEGLAAAAAKLEDSVELLNRLHHGNMFYYQMPVNLSGFRTTAELYVMKRQANKKRMDPHNAVMFVSLETEHIGRIEALLDVKGINVSIGIRTEKAEINDFVKENIRYLYAGLAESGYKLADIRYRLIDKPASPMKQEKLLSKMVEPEHIKLDMRI